MRHFSDIVRGSLGPPPEPSPSPMSILRMLGDKYNMQINNVMMSLSPYTSTRVDMEISMDMLDLEKLCEDIKKSLIMDIPPLVTSLSTSLTALGETISAAGFDDRPCIKCTPEQKENFIQMVDRYCDTCFLGDCKAEDDYDCRKCLERRVRWETE